MADIQPFKAIRYRYKDQSAVVAPPYDVLDAADKQKLLAKSSRNIVAVDLPHVPAKEAGPDAVYAAAGDTLKGWLTEGTLARDEAPAIYIYHQRYDHGGRSYVRRKFFARLRLEEFGQGLVFPHEQTFGGPKEDRLKLMKATRCNLSPIFGLYSDPTNEIRSVLDPVTERDPDYTATMDGVENRVWCLTHAPSMGLVRSLLAPKAVFIADGHHRYGTALNYRNAILGGGTVSPDDPAQFVLAVFGAMEDPGALILPTHRVLIDLPNVADTLRAALADRFEWSDVHTTDADAFTARLAAAAPTAMGVFDGGSGTFAVIQPKEADLLAGFEPRRASAWRRLSYAILHRYVIDEVATPKLNGGRPPTIHYIKNLGDTLAEARQYKAVAFVMKPCTMAELRDICSAGELMPQKTTFFYPKLATGLVINPLY